MTLGSKSFAKQPSFLVYLSLVPVKNKLSVIGVQTSSFKGLLSWFEDSSMCTDNYKKL